MISRRLLSLALLSAAAAFAAVTGSVTNRTNGKPQAGATVTLYKLGAQTGLESVESVKSGPDGGFTLNQTPQGPHLIQTAFAGVTYNHMLPPGQPTEGLALDVWDASAKVPGGAGISTHLVLLEPAGKALKVSESWLWLNASQTSFNNPQGTHRFFVPGAGKEKIRITGTAPQGQPIERAAIAQKQAGVYAIDFPIKPGQTRIDLTYEMPFDADAPGGGKFASTILPGDGPVRLVTPSGVKLMGDGLNELGVEPQSQATIYDFKGKEINVTIEGSGILNQEVEPPSEDEAPGIQQVHPFLYERVYWIVGLSVAIVSLSFFVLYRRSAPR
jgi:hypothetical protein